MRDQQAPKTYSTRWIVRFVYYFVAREMLCRTVDNGSYERAEIGRFSYRKSQRKMNIFAITEERSGQSFVIVELDRDIVKTKLCRKFHLPSNSPFKKLPCKCQDILIDSRVCSIFQ